MCRCTPTMRTPFCGKPGCERPRSPVTNVLIYKTTADRLDALPAFAPSTYVAPERDPA